jgi:hypothetical protein
VSSLTPMRRAASAMLSLVDDIGPAFLGGSRRPRYFPRPRILTIGTPATERVLGAFAGVRIRRVIYRGARQAAARRLP